MFARFTVLLGSIMMSSAHAQTTIKDSATKVTFGSKGWSYTAQIPKEAKPSKALRHNVIKGGRTIASGTASDVFKTIRTTQTV